MNKLMKRTLTAAIAATIILPSSVWAAAANPERDEVLSLLPLYELTNYAGRGDLSYIDGANGAAGFRLPASVAVKSDGTLLTADSRNQRIRAVAASQTSTAAGFDIGTDDYGFLAGGLADGAPSLSAFNNPSAIAIGGEGTAYIADTDNNAVRTMRPDGTVATLAGTGKQGFTDGAAGTALFNNPLDVAVTKDGVVYVADSLNHAIRKIDKGTVTTLNAPSTRIVEYFPGEVDTAGDFKDGPLAEAKFNEPSGLALDAKGNLYVSDTGNHVIRYIDFAAGTVRTVAGGSVGYSPTDIYAAGDFKDGSASEARFNAPRGLAVTPDGGLLIADSLNHAIRYLKDGAVTTVAGTPGETGRQDGLSLSGGLNGPLDVAWIGKGAFAIADTGNNSIRIVKPYKTPDGVTADGTIHLLMNDSVLNSDVQPVIKNGVTYVPVRVIGDELGYQVDNPSSGSATLTLAGSVYQLTAGADTASYASGGDAAKPVALGAVPFISEGRLFVPVRFFAEQMGLDVQWLSESKSVLLRDKLK